jgi:hypothetical protein
MVFLLKSGLLNIIPRRVSRWRRYQTNCDIYQSKRIHAVMRLGL